MPSIRVRLHSLLRAAAVVAALTIGAAPAPCQGGESSAEGAEAAGAAPAPQRERAPSTAPERLEEALAIEVEALKAELRPLRRDEVAAQLDRWLGLLQQSCTAVRDVELAGLAATDAETLQADSARAVELRAERARLIERVRAVIRALDSKGGDVAEAEAYVDSVVVTPPITGVQAAWATAFAWLTSREGGLAMLLALAKALGAVAVFWVLARTLTRLVRRTLRNLTRTSELLKKFLEESVGRVTMFLGLLVALSLVGVDMTPLLAAIGAAGLVIGLALQGTLGNLASGLMIMVYRPFDVGDVISTAGVTGKVEGMTLMTTTVKTGDNQTIHVPNSKIWGDVITNITANDTRRVDLVFGIGYDDDVEAAKGVLGRTVGAHPKVLADPAPVIRVNQLADSSVNLVVRPWARTADYWDVYWDLTEAVKRAFDEAGISIPYPQRDVHLIPAPTES